MGFGGALLAMSAVSGISSISQGYAQKQEAKFNAAVLDNKANLIEEQKQIEFGQYQRLKGKYLSSSVVGAAGAGVALQGSPMAVMLDAQTQINIDQAIGQFNLEQEKQYTKAQASQQRRAGKQAVYSGYSNAFSTVLQGVSNYAMYNKKPKDTTFDSNTKDPKGGR